MPIAIHRSLVCGDLRVDYLRDEDGGMALRLLPTALADALVERRADWNQEDPCRPLAAVFGRIGAARCDGLVQFQVAGAPRSDAYAQGLTMRAAPVAAAQRLVEQVVEEDADGVRVTTRLRSADGHGVEHRLDWRRGEAGVRCRSTYVNGSGAPQILEHLSSIDLAGITPFQAEDAPGRLVLHRFRAAWSAEGRLESRPFAELDLEASWSAHGWRVERMAQVGSLPVRGFHPCAAVEDATAGCTWGVQVCWGGSWQIEVARKGDDVALGGGLADHERGHWRVAVPAGGTFTGPEAWATAAAGGIDACCDRLLTLHRAPLAAQPAAEAALPVVCNEWCTSWGDPRPQRLLALADRLRGSGVRYLVIDAGWFKRPGTTWTTAHGDWEPSRELYPEGLAAVAAAIRARGLVPGLWFEFETVGSASDAWQRTDLLLHRDGAPITAGTRRFLDLRQPAVIERLATRVIGLLRDAGFGYLKIDYNESIGIGCDGAESPGEGLRRQIAAVQGFIARIRRELPELVIESCASGGLRLEPSFLALAAMASGSDAHEPREIPLIAAGLQRLALPRQTQVWAVLHAGDDEHRLVYALAAGFLGRLCLSGDLDRLAAARWAVVAAAMALYRQAAPVIDDGISRRFGDIPASWREPRGWQAVRRLGADAGLVVLHAFAGDLPAHVEVPLADGPWRLAGGLAADGAAISGDRLRLAVAGPWSAQVVLLAR